MAADLTLVPEQADGDRSFRCETDLSAKQYFGVKLDSSNLLVAAGAGDACLGILQNKPNGTAARPAVGIVRMWGLSKLKLAGTVTAASWIKTDADGKGVATTSAGDECIARSLGAAQSGDLAAVMIDRGRY